MYLGLLRPLSLRGGLLRVRNLVRGALPMQKPARAGVQLRLGLPPGAARLNNTCWARAARRRLRQHAAQPAL